VLGIGLDHAVTLIAEKAKARGKGGGPQPLRELGAHPEDGKPVTLHSGRYGPYVKHGRTNASLGKGDDPDSLDLDRAVALIAARQQTSGGKSGGGTGGGGKSGGAKTRSKSQNKSKSKGKAGGSAQSKSRSTSSA